MSQIDDAVGSFDEDLQRRFDGALASFPPSVPPDPMALHERLRRRRIRGRVAGLAGLIVMVSFVVTVGVAGSNDSTSAAVTLYARDDTALSQGELSADAKIIRDRLDALGDRGARVSISDGAIVLTGATAELLNPLSVFTGSPALLVRPLWCQSGPFDGSATLSPQTLPVSCAGTPYAVEPDSPDPSRAGSPSGYSVPSLRLDPALANFLTTTPSADSANPNGSALLPVANGQGERDLVGSTQLTLSASVASARVVQSNSGAWLVDVSLSQHEAALFDEVASKFFHLQLAVDLNGEIVSSPVIEPTESSYRPFDGRMELAGPSQSWAEDIAAALQSGPLPIPLELAHAA
jgi:hypothetical protein